MYSKMCKYGGTYAHKDNAELIKEGKISDEAWNILEIINLM